MIYLSLVYEFFRTGLFAIGGGLATIPFLMEMADKTTWFSKQQLADMIAISESTPGSMGINMATYAGFSAGGVLGGVIATLALIAPSIIIITIISFFLKKFRDSKIVDHGFYGIRPASVAMIISAMLGVFISCIFADNIFELGINWYQGVSWLGLALFAVVLLGAIILKRVHPLVFIGFGALMGIVLQL